MYGNKVTAIRKADAADVSQEMESKGVDVYEIAGLFYRRRWIMLTVFFIIVASGLAYTLTRRPVYESSARFVVAANKPGRLVSVGDVPLLNDVQELGSKRSVDTVVEVVTSPELLQESFDMLSSDTRLQGFGSDSIPEWAYRVVPRRDTDVVEVVGRAYTPAAAAELANTIIETYFKRDIEKNSKATRQARTFAENEIASAGRELSLANTELSRYKKATGLFAPEVQLTKAAESISQIAQDLQSAKAQLSAGQKEVETYRQELSREQPNVVTNQTISRNPRFSSILSKIDSLQSERTVLLQEFIPGSPEIKAMDESIRQEQTRLKEIARNIIDSTVQSRNPIRDALSTSYAAALASTASLEAKVKVLEEEINIKQLAARDMPTREKELAEREQKVALLQRRYETLSSNYYSLMLSEHTVLPGGTLVSQARAPAAPAYPDVKTNLAAFLIAGLLTAMIAVVVVERMDMKLHDQNVIERISGLPALSVIPDIIGQPTRLYGTVNSEGPLLESFRILRHNIYLTGMNDNMRILAVTSPGRGEGKSTSTINLASAMAMDGKRVLLVDGDVRRPSLHRYMVVSRQTGLTSVLTGSVQLDQAIIPSTIKNIDILPSGPACANCVEMLNSTSGRELFSKMAERYDVVLVDCPPVTGLSDVQIISSIADGVLLVVSVNQTNRRLLSDTMKTLTLIGAPLIGLALNKMNAPRYGYSYYYGNEKELELEEPGSC